MLLEEIDPLLIIIAVVVVVLTTTFLWLLRRSPSNRKYILLLGNSNAGKTSIFSRLVYGKQLQTQISFKENKSVVKLEKSTVEIVDIPGYANIRQKFIDQYKKYAKGLVFVVDSENFVKELKDIAMFLFDILNDESLSKFKLPVLVACNKQDIDFVKSDKIIRSNLEKEIETLCKTTSAALSSTGNQNNTKKLKLKSDKSFEFKDLKNFKFEFCECSAIDSEKSFNTEPILKWIEDISRSK